ncbi:hypothetical protein D3C76_757690 [compost metagenome]
MVLALLTLSRVSIKSLSPNTHPSLKPGKSILDKLPTYTTPFPSVQKEAKEGTGELVYKSSSLNPSSITGMECF